MRSSLPGLTLPGLAFVLCAALFFAGCMAPPAPQDPGSEASRRDHCPPVPPAEQQVATVDEILCQGQFAVIEPGFGRMFEAPVWEIGEWWHVEVVGNIHQACALMVRETVLERNESFGVPVYRVSIEMTACDGKPSEMDSSSVHDRTEDALQYLQRSGHINHDLLPGMRDGARWSFMDNTDRFATVELTYVPNYEFGNESMEAWRTKITRAGLNEKFQWWGVEAGNLLREETWHSRGPYAGQLVDIRHLTDSSRGFGSPSLPE